MAILGEHIKDVTILTMLNKCQLYLQVYFISEILNPGGTLICSHILDGRPGPKINNFAWPRQGKQFPSDWAMWGHHMRSLADKFCHKVQEWLQPEDKSWFYAPLEEALIKWSGEHWLKFKRTLRTRQGYFDLCGTQPPGSRLEQAHVSQFTGYKVCHGTAPILHPATTPRSLIQYISNLDVAKTWCLQDIHVNQEEVEKIRLGIMKGTAIAVSDGSFKATKGAAVGNCRHTLYREIIWVHYGPGRGIRPILIL
jgi:hypothetical protein